VQRTHEQTVKLSPGGFNEKRCYGNFAWSLRRLLQPEGDGPYPSRRRQATRRRSRQLAVYPIVTRYDGQWVYAYLDNVGSYGS
jgi:hypothetical protein